MKMTYKIDLLMKINNIKDYAELSKISNIPYTTIKGLYTKGYDNTKRDTLIKLSKALNCTLDELADDNIELEIKKILVKKQDNEIEKLTPYLNENQKALVVAYIRGLLSTTVEEEILSAIC